MAKREFLMAAHTYDDSRDVKGWWWSEKLDGMRAFWDGGKSRNVPKHLVPWANTEKDKRYKIPPVATGLWSRYGHVINAPDWFLDMLPEFPLDGELWCGRGGNQTLMSIAKKLEPDEKAWEKVQYWLFDIPDYNTVFANGTIDITNFKKEFKDIAIKGTGQLKLRDAYLKLRKEIDPKDPNLKVLLQLAFKPENIYTILKNVTDTGGEGIVLRNPDSYWEPRRSWNVLKVKPFNDDEATVVGYITGRVGKEGKHLGRLGALILDYNGKRLELSGFTDSERELYSLRGIHARAWAEQNPETECPDWIYSKEFPIGSKVTFIYRELTKDGIPKEARYWRKRED